MEPQYLEPLCIFGPTAAGKSALAIALAQRLHGVVINADALQVYSGLRVLTARPSEAEERLVPHRLFGLLDPADPCNAVRWARLAGQEIAAAQAAGLRPILVGGTGLYFRALLEGLDDIPAIDPALRREVRALTLAELRAVLGVQDGDRQRLTRQLEVLRQTGRPLAAFQQQRATAPMAHRMVRLLPPRGPLYARIDARFEAMLRDGAAQEEVRQLLARGLPEDLPSMRAIGVPELLGYWRNDWSLAEATRKAQQASRNYAKRQYTWGRNQISADWTLDALLQNVAAVADQLCADLGASN